MPTRSLAALGLASDRQAKPPDARDLCGSAIDGWAHGSVQTVGKEHSLDDEQRAREPERGGHRQSGSP